MMPKSPSSKENQARKIKLTAGHFSRLPAIIYIPTCITNHSITSTCVGIATLTTLPDYLGVSQSPIRVTKSPGYKGEGLKYEFSSLFGLITFGGKFEIFDTFMG